MDAIRTLWPNVVNGAETVKEVVKNEVIAKLPSKLSGRSLEALVARDGEHGHSVMQTIASVLLSIQTAVVVLFLLTLSYTLGHIFPTLAIVEDAAPPPSYTAIADQEPVDSKDGKDTKTAFADEEAAPPAKPVTASLRATWKLLKSIDGNRSLFRGLPMAIAGNAAVFAVALTLSMLPFVHPVIAVFVASMITLQFNAAWVHVVISEPSKKSLWQRLPPLGQTFRATALPAVIFNLSSSFMGQIASYFTSLMLGRKANSNDVVAYLLMTGLYLLLLVFVSIPSHVVLVRVQASLLPKDDQTIVALDRGLAMHRAEGNEYMTMIHAWRSFSRASWVRLVKQYVKVFGLHMVIYMILAGIAIVEFLVASLLA
ncbi:uncharacterized protein F4822DRAFT_429005 [Hypoxylon trugodes]|uniref:uncharacterized protein n=1 Tax=Hypoxylon trugodes TaxID=326681 RepID=UPI00219B19F0|nr:uncharacterized protein F4822DRAFT_429005 [Hypoxylon trugodes]KAI1388380.1 hypothetical protein F4822DRAFT_429005 [Hypoxylon trugodes]